jgi:type IV pilus assembly protein PilO
MTFADDFATGEQGAAEDYPSAFGITFTPQVTGIAISVIGIVGAGYMFINMVRPAQQKYQEASTKKEELQGQLNKINTGDLQLKLAQTESDLANKKALRSRVVAMFTQQNDLETLLLDLNGFIAANQGELVQYEPDTATATVDDTSLGEEVQGKLKRQGISFTVEGTFNQTKGILRDLERLQPLLMIQSISSTVNEKPTVILTSNRSELISKQEAELKTQIKLDAILPLSEEEIEMAKKEAEAAAEEETADGKEKKTSKLDAVKTKSTDKPEKAKDKSSITK